MRESPRAPKGAHVVIALAGGAWIFLGGVLAFLIGAVIAMYTRKGSGMDLHPYRHVHGGAPGADSPAHDYGGAGRTGGGGRRRGPRGGRHGPPRRPPPRGGGGGPGGGGGAPPPHQS